VEPIDARPGRRRPPIIYHLRPATCSQPEVKRLTMMTNSQYNGWHFEDVWLDK
jgi:hypothetical protein